MAAENLLFDWRKAIMGKQGPKAPNTRYVLLALSLRMDTTGASCFPSVETLAAETLLSRRSVITHLALAESAGWIKRTPRALPGQAWKRNEYTANLPENVVQSLHRLTPEGGATVSPPLCEGGANDDTKVVQPLHPSSSVNSSVCGAPEKKTAKRKTPAPDHLPVTDAMTAFAKSKGYTGDLAELTATFLDHHRAKGSLFIDWTAAWRTWLRNEIRFSANRPASHMTPTAAAAEGHRGANLITGRSTHA